MVDLRQHIGTLPRSNTWLATTLRLGHSPPTRHLLGAAAGRAHTSGVTHADPAQLAEKLRGVIAAFEQASDESPPIKRSLEINTIELELGASASGRIALIGKLEVGADAGIAVTLRRSRPEE